MMLTPLHAEERRAAVLGVVELLERGLHVLGIDARVLASSRTMNGAIAS